MSKNLVVLEYWFIFFGIIPRLYQFIPPDVSYTPKNLDLSYFSKKSAEFSEEELLVLERDVYDYYSLYGNVPPQCPPSCGDN